MSNAQNIQNLPVSKLKVSEQATPIWQLVCKRELTDLWIGGKALNLMLIYSLLLSVMVYVYSFNTELSLMPPREATYEMLKIAMAVSMFVALIIAADTLSGERERATLESLLLTPANRRQIILGKLLAAFSIWPATYIIVIPYLYILAQGDSVLASALLWGAVTGTILVLGYAGLGMLVSFWSGSNKVSYFMALGVYVALLVPAELPAKSSGAAGQFLLWVNPMASVNHFLLKHLVNYHALDKLWTWLLSSVGLLVASIGLLVLLGGSLRLKPGTGSKVWSWLGRAIGLPVLAGVLVVSLLLVSPAYALHAEEALSITIDTESKHLKTGDTLAFHTMVTNTGAEASPPLIVAMNVINLDATGDVVDPEDWSPERTQYLNVLAPGDSVELGWIINPILEGEFMVYMVLLPEPAGSQSTTDMVTSAGIHLTVDPFTRLNPGGVLPFAVGGPLFILVITYFVYRRRRQQIDVGGFS